jgi:hypothetical protein
MGTNYYHRTNICEHCGRYDETHIGKSSAGWVFGFQAIVNYDNCGHDIATYAQWLERLKAGGKIVDEYNGELTVEEFIKVVEDRSHPNGLSSMIQYGHQYWSDKCGDIMCDFTYNDFS